MLRNVFIGVKLRDFELRKFASQALRKPRRCDPQLKPMVSKNKQLAFGL
jgi:hypothetical protein